MCGLAITCLLQKLENRGQPQECSFDRAEALGSYALIAELTFSD